MDDGHDSLKLLDGLIDGYSDTFGYVLVRNFGRGRDFSKFDGSEARRKAEAADAQVMDLGELHAPTMQKIDHLGNSFWAAVSNKDASLAPCLGLVERQRVWVWLRKAYAEIERLPCFNRQDEPIGVIAPRGAD